MWNKQKLTRKSLDELADIMPVLSEDEQGHCIGGADFYDLSGNFLDSVGPGSDIRIISQRDLNTAMQESQNNNDYTYKSSSSWGSYIQQESNLSSDSVKNIISHITGMNQGNILVSSGKIEEAASLVTSGYYLIQIDRTSLSLRNTESLKSTMRHETNHIMRPTDNTWLDEDDAYMDQTSDSSFKSLPLDYRQRIAEMWEYQARKYYNEYHSGVIPSGELEAIRERCGVR